MALAGGVARAAIAGARRTASAFPRYLAASRATDVAVDVGPMNEEAEYTLEAMLGFTERARAIDGVVDDATYIGLETMYPVIDGELGSAEVFGSLDGRFIDLDRVAIRDGRVPRADRVDEVFVNETAASLGGLRVGDHLVLQARGGFGEGNPLDAPVLGLVMGPLAWQAFARDLGAAPSPVLPILLLACASAALVVAANAIGEGPARQATKVPVRSPRDA